MKDRTDQARRHCKFLNEAARYFEIKAAAASEDITFQASSNNARNLIAASNFIAVLMSERTPPTSEQE